MCCVVLFRTAHAEGDKNTYDAGTRDGLTFQCENSRKYLADIQLPFVRNSAALISCHL